MNPLPPLSPNDFANLRASIECDGVLVPIAVRTNGNIIDGHNRKSIADNLGIPCPTEVFDVDDTEAERLALKLNLHRRQLTVGQKRAIEDRLRSLGMSTRAIAEATGTSQRAVADHGSSLGEQNRSPSDGKAKRRRVSGRDGRTYPAHKPTASERDRLITGIGEAYSRGYPIADIAKAFDIAEKTVPTYVRLANVPKRPKNIAADDRPAEPLAPVDWTDPPVSRERPPLYQVSTTLALIVAQTNEFRNDGAENRFANDVADAMNADDQAWLTKAAKTIHALQSYLSRLESILQDQKSRDQAIRSKRNDGRVLRVVKNEAS